MEAESNREAHSTIFQGHCSWCPEGFITIIILVHHAGRNAMTRVVIWKIEDGFNSNWRFSQ
jgi:hypothetical protein